MTTTDKTDTTVNNMDLELWGEEGGEDQSFLVAGNETRYARPQWMSGHQMMYTQGAKGEPKGFHFKEETLPADLLTALKTLQEQGKAKRVEVRHNAGNLVWYWTLKTMRVYALTHGTPKTSDILKGGQSRLGLAYGILSYEDREDKNKISTTPFMSVLAVCDELFRAGYVDDDGLPKLIELRMDGLYVPEFQAELTKHVMMLTHAVNNLGFAKKHAQYWAYAQTLTTSEEKVAHGKGKTTYVYTINSLAPAKDSWNKETLEELYCGDELFRILFPMVIDMTKTPRVPGGLAVDWCNEVVEAAIKNQAQYISPTGKTLQFGTHEKPDWVKNRVAAENASVYSQGYVQSQVGNAAAPTPTLFDDLRTEFSNKGRFFDKRGSKDGTALVAAGLTVLANAENKPVKTVEEEAMTLLSRAGVLMQELLTSTPF